MDFDFLDTFDLAHGGTVIILCGPPGAGKSTIAEKIHSQYYNFEIVAPDRIRDELEISTADHTKNDILFATVYNRIKELLYDGKNVIYDATNCRSIYRHKIINLVRADAYKIICLVATTSIAECLRRNSERGQVVPEDVIERMYFNLRKHPPVVFEGYDMIVGF